MDLMKRGPGRAVARAPALAETIIESAPPPIASEPVSLDARRLGRKVTKGPVWNYPAPELADSYDDDLPPAA